MKQWSTPIPRSHDASGPTGGGALAGELVDRYLDGELTDREREDFELRLKSDRSLLAQVEAGRAADQWLRRAFSPPAETFATATLAAAMSPAPIPLPAAAKSRRSSRWIPYGLAAALALGAVAAWQLGVLPGSAQIDPAARIARGDAAAWMRHVIATGYKPDWVCKDDADLARYTKEKFGNEWKIAPAPELTLVGWTYTSRVLEGEYSSVLLARWQDRPVTLVVDSLQNDRAVRPASDGSIKVHRRELCDVVIYEISSLDSPVLLDRITVLPR